MDTLLLRVQTVERLGGYRLRLGFSDGKVKDVDLESELWGPVFEPLRDPGYFSQVRVDPEARTIVWPNGADLAPDFLYSIGKDAKAEAA